MDSLDENSSPASTVKYSLHSQMIVLFGMGTMTKKNVAYRSYLYHYYLPSEMKQSLMLKPRENKCSLMPLHVACFIILCCF